MDGPTFKSLRAFSGSLFTNIETILTVSSYFLRDPSHPPSVKSRKELGTLSAIINWNPVERPHWLNGSVDQDTIGALWSR